MKENWTLLYFVQINTGTPLEDCGGVWVVILRMRGNRIILKISSCRRGGWDYVSELLPLTGLLFISQVILEYGEPRWNGMIPIGESRRPRRKPVTVPLSPPQIANGPTRARTRSSAVKHRRLTAWDMARPKMKLNRHNTLCTNIILQALAVVVVYFRIPKDPI
jgi:hypothetical protein